MRRHRLRAALLIVVAAVVGAVAWGAWTTARSRRGRSLAELGLEVLPDVAQRMQNFTRVKVDDHGRTEWELSADEARYFAERDEIVVRGLRITFHLENGRRAGLRGAEGVVTLAGRDIEFIVLSGGVTVALDAYELETASATYERARDLVVAPGPVTARGPDLDLKADRLELEVAPQRVRFGGGVETVLKGAARAS